MYPPQPWNDMEVGCLMAPMTQLGVEAALVPKIRYSIYKLKSAVSLKQYIKYANKYFNSNKHILLNMYALFPNLGFWNLTQKVTQDFQNVFCTCIYDVIFKLWNLLQGKLGSKSGSVFEVNSINSAINSEPQKVIRWGVLYFICSEK